MANAPAVESDGEFGEPKEIRENKLVGNAGMAMGERVSAVIRGKGASGEKLLTRLRVDTTVRACERDFDRKARRYKSPLPTMERQPCLLPHWSEKRHVKTVTGMADSSQNALAREGRSGGDEVDSPLRFCGKADASPSFAKVSVGQTPVRYFRHGAHHASPRTVDLRGLVLQMR